MPTATQYKVALADCLMQLGRLRMKDDRAGAEKDFEQARAINGRLAAQHDNARLRAGWFERSSKWRSIRGFDQSDRESQIVPNKSARISGRMCSKILPSYTSWRVIWEAVSPF